MSNTSEIQARATASPQIPSLIAEYRRCSPWAWNWNRVGSNEDIRFMRWPNQFADGRKHDVGDVEAKPFDGACDARIPLADGIINEDVALKVNAFWRAMVRPKAGQREESNYAVKLVDWLMNVKLFHELIREVELSAQYQDTCGWVVVHPTWETEVTLELKRVSLEELAGLAMRAAQADPAGALAQLPALVLDPAREAEAVAALREVYGMYAQAQAREIEGLDLPEIKDVTLRRLCRELREKGDGKVPLPMVTKHQPAFYALKPWDEIFVPNDLTDIQNVGERPVFRRVWFTEAQLRATARQKGWNQKWVEEAVKLKGKWSTWGSPVAATPANTSLAVAMSAQASATWALAETKQDLIEVIYAHRRQVDDEDVLGVYCTIFHPLIGVDPTTSDARDLCAWHGLMDYAHGQLPYVAGQRENWHRTLTSSRGVPEIVATWQRLVKVHTDALTDLTSVTVGPPLLVPAGARGTKFKFGAFQQNTVKPGLEPRVMDMGRAPGAPVAFELMDRIERQVDNYFGRTAADVPPARQMMKQQMAVTGFLLMWTRAFQQMLCLCQAHMRDAEFAEVTGAPLGWLEKRRGQQGLFYADLWFDVRELDTELVMKQLEVMGTMVIPSDAGGRIDRNAYVELQTRMVNPEWARVLLRDAGDAGQAVFDAVMREVALMFQGNAPKLVENDPAAQAKLQYLAQIVQGNPVYQAELARGGRFTELMQAYEQSLKFSYEQNVTNKQIGRVGVDVGELQGAA